MNSTAKKISWGIAGLTVVGRFALAFPAVSSVVTTAQTLGSNTAKLLEGLEPESEPAGQRAASTADLPEGYVDIGEGISIPAGGPGDCTASSFINITRDDGSPWRASLLGPDLVDMGPREFAAGDVGYAADGRIATYTVEPGDSPWSIGDRFCLNNGNAVPLLNGLKGYEAIQPGQVLVLNPEAVPDFEFVDPYDE